MASVLRRSVDGSEKGSASRDDEKRSHEDEEIASVIDSVEGDEALKLVGRERTAQFSEEYNRKLRRKLVSEQYCDRHHDVDGLSGPAHSANLCGGVLHSIPVSMQSGLGWTG